MADIELIEQIPVFGIPDTVTIHGDTAKPEPYSYDTDEIEFYEYVCFDENDGSFEIRVHRVLERGLVWIRAFANGSEIDSCYVKPLEATITAAIRKYEKMLNER